MLYYFMELIIGLQKKNNEFYKYSNAKLIVYEINYRTNKNKKFHKYSSIRINWGYWCLKNMGIWISYLTQKFETKHPINIFPIGVTLINFDNQLITLVFFSYRKTINFEQI